MPRFAQKTKFYAVQNAAGYYPGQVLPSIADGGPWVTDTNIHRTALFPSIDIQRKFQ